MFLKGLFEDPSYRMRLKLGLFEGEGEDGGGAGSDGGEPQQIEGEGGALDQQQNDQSRQGELGGGERAPGAQGRGHNPNFIPKHRFDQVNRGYQAYRPFGSPADIKAKLERLAYLEKNPQNRYKPEQVDEIKSDFNHLFPGMQGMEAFYENQKRNFVKFGSRQNDRYVKELGWENNDHNKHMIEDAISGMIGRNPELNERFYALDNTLFDEVFAMVKKVLGARSGGGGGNGRNVPGLQQLGAKRPAKAGPVSEVQKTLNDKLKDEKPNPLKERDILSAASDAAFDLIESREG